MVAIIVVAVMIASVLRAKYGLVAMTGRSFGRARGNASGSREVRTLRRHINVLERIAVEKEKSLSRQIEELRDR
jgi:hypothetical protein